MKGSIPFINCKFAAQFKTDIYIMAQAKPDNVLNGLSDKQVQESREAYGWNLLTPPKRPSMWKLYLEKFNDPVIRILLVAAFFSFVISVIEGEYAETIGIFFAIF